MCSKAPRGEGGFPPRFWARVGAVKARPGELSEAARAAVNVFRGTTLMILEKSAAPKMEVATAKLEDKLRALVAGGSFVQRLR